MKQKIHLLLSKDDFREALKHALLTKENLVVTNAHALVSHSTSDIFDQSFIDAIPKGKWLINEPCLKHMNKNKVTYFIEDNSIVVVDKGTKTKYEMLPDGKGYNYPEWKSVIPEEKDICEASVIPLNPKMLFELKQAINPDCYGVSIHPTGSGRSIIIKTIGGDVKNYKALIMPMALDV